MVKKFARWAEINLIPLTIVLILLCLTILFIQADANINPNKDMPGGEWSLLFLIPLTIPLFEGVDKND